VAKAAVCKTVIHRFESGCRLQIIRAAVSKELQPFLAFKRFLFLICKAGGQTPLLEKQISAVAYEDAFRGLARYRGVMSGAGDYAEVFEVIRICRL
jgi:hypothetical protein